MNAPDRGPHNVPTPLDDRLQKVYNYYADATKDYAAWSSDFNMHFGYWRWGLNPLRRERMLQELSYQVIRRLALPKTGCGRLADLGGGTGATARVVVQEHGQIVVDVVTLSPLQIEIGKQLTSLTEGGSRIQWHCCDYERSTLETERYDSVCLIESSCYGSGADKRRLFEEIHRILKPGGTFVMVDAMLKRPLPIQGLTSAWRRQMYRAWCTAWAVPELCQIERLKQVTAQIEFQEVTIEDWSYRIAPSVAHAPFLVIYHAVREVIKARGLLSKWRWRHLVASFLSPWIGILERNFVYVAVVGKKAQSN